MSGVCAGDRSGIASSLELYEFVRRARPASRRARGHREWLHFFVATERIELFVNLSLFDDLRPAAASDERARVLLLARTRDGWRGAIDEPAPANVDAPGGQLRARFGQTTLELEGSELVLRGASRDGALSFDLRLEALSFPSLATDVRVGPGNAQSAAGRFSWLVVPSLAATGTIRVGDALHEVRAARAYHDHNWGFFAHSDFRWQWAHANDGSRFSLVLTRLLDGVGNAAYEQALFLWDGPRIIRIFRGRDLQIAPRGFLGRRSFTIPAVASLLAAGATEVPRYLDLVAQSAGDELRGTVELEDSACLVLCEDARLETTLLYESVGRIELKGTLAGHAERIEATIVVETMRSRASS